MYACQIGLAANVEAAVEESGGACARGQRPAIPTVRMTESRTSRNTGETAGIKLLNLICSGFLLLRQILAR